jgi:hypothetical protein
MTICAVAQEVLFLRQMFTNLNIKPSRPTRMLEDDNGCIALATNPMTKEKQSTSTSDTTSLRSW